MEDLEVFDFDAKEFIPEDAKIVETEFIEIEETNKPTTHGIEEAIDGSLEEE